MKSIYLLLIGFSLFFVSCKKAEDGAQGPAGESYLKQQGSFSGTITYKDDNGNDATTSVNYKYYETLDENSFTYYADGTDADYDVEFVRKDPSDTYNYVEFDLEGSSSNGVDEIPAYINTDLSFLTLVNNEIVVFDGIYDVEITNFNLDHTTGRVTFNYTGDLYKNTGTYSAATITGSVDVILNRVKYSNF